MTPFLLLYGSCGPQCRKPWREHCSGTTVRFGFLSTYVVWFRDPFLEVWIPEYTILRNLYWFTVIIHWPQLFVWQGPEFSRTNTWGGGKRGGDNVTHTRTYTSATLPSRGARKGYDSSSQPEEERRRSAEDLLDSDESRSRGKVPLVTKDELVRSYTSGSTSSDTLRLEPVQHEIKRSLKEDLNLEHEQGEGGFVRESIRRNEGFIQRQSVRNDLESAPPEVTTRTMVINSEREPTVYRQNQPPEVQTQVLSFGGSQNGDPGAYQGTRYRYNASSPASSPEPYAPHTRHYNVPSVTTQRVVYDQNGPPVSPPSRG